MKEFTDEPQKFGSVIDIRLVKNRDGDWRMSVDGTRVPKTTAAHPALALLLLAAGFASHDLERAENDRTQRMD